jgi:hypothetical protein
MLKSLKLFLIVLTLCLLTGCASFSQSQKVDGLDICKSDIKIFQLTEEESVVVTDATLRNMTYVNCTLQKVCKRKVPNGELCEAN